MLFSSTSFLKNTCLLAVLGILAACSTPVKNSPVMAGKLLASWVVLGAQGQAVARAVTTEASCPTLLQDGVAQRMHVRAKAETIAQRKTVSIPADSKASQFPVLTCEAILNSGVASVSIEGIPLPLPKPSAQKIIVIGDTGCRMKKADHYYQACNDTSQWAFEEVIRTAASFKPDLVIHVGDFHYRENACAEGSADCAGSPWGYGWDTWQADFFAPAAPLLAVAPWVMVRGNHESCVRAGQGWWRFMDPRPLEPGRDCNLERDDAIGDYSAPYAIPLGPVAGAAAQLIVFDSARVPVKAMASTDSAYQIYTQQLKSVDSLADQADFSIFINHHPILGFAPGYLPGNAALQDIMKNRHPQRLFPAKVQATVAGHVHLFEAITFASDHPTQFVSGNGGSSLDTPLSMPRPDDVTPYSGAQIAHFSNTNEVGFMSMERIGKSWKMEAWDQRGKRLTSCMMQDRKTLCQDEK